MNDQRSLAEQLHDLVALANKHGLYDAADWVQNHAQPPAVSQKDYSDLIDLRLKPDVERNLQKLEQSIETIAKGIQGEWYIRRPKTRV